ncbi:MAG: 23S rRNA (pseudouridine(1915)-N(3))-methyltransferase RlmH [Bacteroidales bacterium]|nr:23S rRNA (pseudouridine(1915)-N(3))-methyltransferase RlmH [Bacteroidales bacterium]
MKIRLITVGKTDVAYIQVGIEEYASRLQHYTDFAIHTIPSLKNSATLSPEEIKKREGELILKQLSNNETAVLLDEHGQLLTSVQFSEMILRQQNAGIRNLSFIIGGAYGFSQQVYNTVPLRLSLAKMTFNHQMVRLFFVEQLYRAHTILRHEKYHNA